MDIGIDSTSEPCNKIPQSEEITTELNIKVCFFLYKDQKQVEGKQQGNNKVNDKIKK